MLQTNNYKISYLSQYKNELPKFAPIAPSPEDGSNMDCTLTKKYTYKNNYSGAQAASIARRNARERNRVKQVNDGFNALRKRLPAAIVNALSGGARRGSGKKLSKVDTLRMVVEYIRYLENIIEDSDATLGINQESQVVMETSLHSEVDEGIFGGRNSPYSDSVPSPANSECSSGVSTSCSTNDECYQGTRYTDVATVDDNELLDAITWWQQK
ncbi:achaete-scute complex protein T3-like [Nymphalis io]|uniref:achaete-scute complex protein T3-like n=1 Tax=Inachis io TaxID=171585 RepID=UPI0021674015|nr:achaete-scute complex protein T3-like [Nymphalis io]